MLVNWGISILAWTYRTMIMQKNGRACMISCIHACVLNQTGKSSLMEVYRDNENHDYDHENDSQSFHAVKVHYIHHPRRIATIFQTSNPTFRVKMGAEFWKSLSNFSKVAPKNEPIHPQNDQWKRLHSLLLVIDFGTDRNFFTLILKNLTSPIFSNIATFDIGSPLPQLLLASTQVVDPKCFT